VLFLHEVHAVKGKRENDFETAMREEWMPLLAREDDARLLYFTRQAHGSGKAYQVITITAVRDGSAWEKMARRIQGGEWQGFMAELDATRHDVQGKLLVPVYWSPLQQVDFRQVASDGREHDPSLFMEDTGWPHAPLDDYIRFWDEDYYQVLSKYPKDRMLLDIQACFQVAHGAGQRREGVLWQKIVSPERLTDLLSRDIAPEHKAPGSYMAKALEYRDDWQSRLLRTARWSPMF
jgi:hypothetical protein